MDKSKAKKVPKTIWFWHVNLAKKTNEYILALHFSVSSVERIKNAWDYV
jgi:hypothetical protein